MISVTDEAAKYLHDIVDQHDVPEGKTLRLMQNARGMGFAIDKPKQADRKVECQGKVVLCVSKEFDKILGERTLALKTTEQGPQLFLN